ncbi:MAG: nitroreductase family protein [Oscillospiraceae bacterium]|nr:nitroreductase family protein [Oscillospiraceae bacterium]
MTFQELAHARYSVRSFQDTPIEEETMKLILEAGRVAPTACNNQPQKIYVATSEEARRKLASVCRCTFDAPVILVVCYDRTRDWKNKLQPGYESGETDAAIVCTHMMLQAFELGVGSCWVGYFNAQAVSEILGLPENVTVSALLPMGYPGENAKPLPLHSQFRDFEDTISVI